MILYLDSADVLSIEPERFGRRARAGRGEAARKVQKLQIADFELCAPASCCRSGVRRKVQKLKIGDSGGGQGGSGGFGHHSSLSGGRESSKVEDSNIVSHRLERLRLWRELMTLARAVGESVRS